MTNRIKLNVGGTIFETHKDTLRNATFFSDMMDDSEPPFIDMDPIAFGYVIKYLRQPKLVLPAEYLEDYKYYGLPIKTLQLSCSLGERLTALEQQLETLTATIDSTCQTVREIKDLQSTVNKVNPCGFCGKGDVGKDGDLCRRCRISRGI